MALLYLISPPKIDDVGAFAAQLLSALEAGDGAVGAFQLRLKAEPAEGLAHSEQARLTLPSACGDVVLRAAELLIPVCHRFEIPFILNDLPELARECGADGVHLGQEDGAIMTARALLGEEAVIGVTCHNSHHLAMEAGEAGADYVAFGAFYPTTSKTEAAQKHWGVPTPEILSIWSETTTVPCVAIGGITPENCRPLVEAGADFIAVITAVWQHPEGAAAGVREFTKHLRK